MLPKAALIRTHHCITVLVLAELETLAADQQSLNAYAQKRTANKLVVNAQQQRLNTRYDNLNNIHQLLKRIPEFTEYLLQLKDAELENRTVELLQIIHNKPDAPNTIHRITA